MMNPSASLPRNQFAAYGTSANLLVLERNREITKPQMMELFVVRTVLAGFEPACAVGAGCMCHRSEDEPPVLFFYVHTSFQPIVLTNKRHRISM